MLFSQYMNEWLYGKDGYYKDFKDIGKSGDFYTAVSTSRFFGASIANYFYTLIKSDISKRDGYLIEIGAHRGYLLCDMVEWLYSIDSTLIDSLKFAIVERQPKVKEAQIEYIKSRLGEEFEIKHFDDVSDIDVDYAFMVSNEIFDAFSCELYRDNKIADVKDDKVEWIDAPQNILSFASRYRLQKGEIAIGYEEFAQNISKGVNRCDFVSFDYGEKYVRNDFSIRVYQSHKTFPLFDEELVLKDSFQRDDITYDVNFDHIIDAFSGVKFKEIKYLTQAKALVEFGLIDILDMFAKVTTQKIYQKEVDKIKTLISPTLMGDRFKMIHLSKDN